MSEIVEEKLSTAEMFLSRFSGYKGAYLTYPAQGQQAEASGKIKPLYQTVRETLTAEKVESHLAGHQSIGLSPVRDDGTCTWGVIDVDEYNIPSDDFIRAVNKLAGTKAAIHRSKSMGMHVWLFASEPVPAADMHAALKVISKRINPKWKKEFFPPAHASSGNTETLPKAVNLPYFGKTRKCYALCSERGVSVINEADNRPERYLQLVSEHLLHSGKEVSAYAGKDAQDSFDGVGYREPKDASGRNDFLYKAGCSAWGRGATAEEVSTLLHHLNEKHCAEDHPHWAGKGQLDAVEIKGILASIKKLPVSTRAELHYDVVANFNKQYAVLLNGAKVEYIDISSTDLKTMPHESMAQWTANKRVKIGGKYVQIFRLWVADPDRLEYEGLVYDKDNANEKLFNLWHGYSVEPKEGDIAPFLEYIHVTLCGGDVLLAIWIIHWLADAVQNPTRQSTPTALMLRGPQGQGKTHLSRYLRLILGPYVVEVANAKQRLFNQFNRQLAGKTFVFAEEALFSGDPQLAQMLKTFISASHWTYEEKYCGALTIKCAQRLLATTNQLHATLIDPDDRRWTIVDVPMRFDLTIPEQKELSDIYWKHQHEYLKTAGPALLHYLLGIKVDENLIRTGYLNAAKVDEKISSNPLLDLIVALADSACLPFDLDGTGVVSSQNFHEVFKQHVGNHPHARKSSGEITKEIIRLGLATSCRSAIYTKVGSIYEGIPQLTNIKFQRGLTFLPLPLLRKKLDEILKGHQWDAADSWKPYEVIVCGAPSSPVAEEENIPF